MCTHVLQFAVTNLPHIASEADLLMRVNVVVDPAPLGGNGLQQVGIVVGTKSKGVDCGIKLLQGGEGESDRRLTNGVNRRVRL